MKHCLVVYDSDGLEEKIAIIEIRNGDVKVTELPFKVTSDTKYVVHNTDKGWFVLSLSEGSVYSVAADGGYHKIDALGFDPATQYMELHPIWSGHDQTAYAILIDHKTIVTDRTERYWSIISQNLSVSTTQAVSGCFYEGL